MSSHQANQPTNSQNHDAVVGSQFGARAGAYLTSTVHSQGPDLDAMAAIVRGMPDGKTARVLDLGCGGGHVAYTVAPYVKEVVAYDLSPEMLAVVAGAAKDKGLANIVTREGVAEHLPFADASFDVVMSRYTAHHWHDFEAGLREAARVLKPGGVAAFVDSISPGVPLYDTFYQAIEMLRDCSHVRNYARVEWDRGISRAGLVPGTARQHRLRLDFASWVARMRTPQVQIDAIRALQTSVSANVVRQFEIEPDGSFTFDVGFFEAVKLR